MRRREALGRIFGAATLPLIGASCDFDRLLQPDFAATDAGFATLIGAGDLHATNVALVPRRRTAALVKKVLDADPAAMAFMVGDLTHNGTRAELDQWYAQTWGVFKSRTLFTIGNHHVEHATPPGRGSRRTSRQTAASRSLPSSTTRCSPVSASTTPRSTTACGRT